MKIKDWVNYFEANKQNPLVLTDEEYTISESERRKITASIQSFQLGESSEGHILKKQAREQSEKTNEPEYLEAIEHLIREENLHSAYLGHFMRQHSIPRLERGLNDSCFRFLRRLAGVELSSRILVVAEVIALTYYDCLGDSTGSIFLKNICARMCKEEQAHVEFQMFQIHRMNFQKHTLKSSLANIFHFCLLLATLLPVWVEHKSVLKTKYSFGSFCKKVWTDFQNATYQGQRAAAEWMVEAGLLPGEVICT